MDFELGLGPTLRGLLIHTIIDTIVVISNSLLPIDVNNTIHTIHTTDVNNTIVDTIVVIV